MFPSLTTAVQSARPSTNPLEAELDFRDGDGPHVRVTATALEIVVRGMSTSVHVRDRAGRDRLELLAGISDESSMSDGVLTIPHGRGPILDPVRRLVGRLSSDLGEDHPVIVGHVGFEALAGVDPGPGEAARFLVPSAGLVDGVPFRSAGAGLECRPSPPPEPHRGRGTTREEFVEGVRRIRRHLGNGDAYQVVLSRFRDVAVRSSSGDLYESLRRGTGAPFMYRLEFGGRYLVGASPERHLRVGRKGTEFHAEVMPIAGTRPTDSEGRQLARLLTDPKELAEHMMLVDLARNDLARISSPGTRKVADLMTVRQCGPVQHLVSRVTGTLRDGIDGLKALATLGPMGTLSGAPKKSAVDLITSIEPVCRGSYGGAVLVAFGDGTLDSAIAIRSIDVRAGIGRVHAGAGIVIGSDPCREFEETKHKMAAALAALTGEQ